MKKIIWILFVSLSAPTFATEKQEVDDFHTLLSVLLKINQDKFTYVDAQGKTQRDELKVFKEVENIYIRYVASDRPYGKHSEARLKILMLFAFYANNHNSAIFLENLAADLVPIYAINKPAFLRSLNGLPYMIPAVCGRLSAYFGHEGKNAHKKKSFINDNKKLIFSGMTKKNANLCLKEFANGYPGE